MFYFRYTVTENGRVVNEWEVASHSLEGAVARAMEHRNPADGRWDLDHFVIEYREEEE